MRIVIGTRGSALALWQANWVRDRLAIAGCDVQIKTIRTSGDKLERAPLAASGVKGLFIKEIEQALAEGSIDLAVHSLKDLPAEQPPGLVLAAVPSREDARDVLVSRSGIRFQALPPGSRVATSSVRRQSQLRHLRPDLEYVPIRGNVDTRLRKLDHGECDALVLAAAGLLRLGLGPRIAEYFPPDQLCSAPGQGALAIEIRGNSAAQPREADDRLAEAVAALDDPAAHGAVRAERALLRRLGGGCSVPIAAYAEPTADALNLTAVVARPDGSRLIRASARGPAAQPEELGLAVAEDLLRRGVREILEAS